MQTLYIVAYNDCMKTNPYIIKNDHIQSKTDFPLYTETYHMTPLYNDDFHSHEFFEIGITIDGEAIHHMTNEEQLLKRGHVYLIPIGQSHCVHVPMCWHLQNIYFLPRLIFQNLSTTSFPNPLFDHFLLKLIQKESIFQLSLSEAAVMDIERLIAVQEKISLSNRQLIENYRCNCLLNMLMILCEAYYEQYPSEISSTDVRITKILALINTHIYTPTGDLIERISLELALHPQYINKMVKHAFNTTLSNLILETKVEKSCEFLLSHHSITETAQALAFYDHSHYNKFFIKYFGITPSQYRNKYLGHETTSTSKEAT